MSTMNKTILVGNLGQDPEVAYTTGGTAVAKLSLATTDGFGERQKTNWHRVTVFGKQAESVAKFLSKGSKVGVVGRLEYSKSEGKDGTMRYFTDVIADNVTFLDSKGGAAADEEDPF